MIQEEESRQSKIQTWNLAQHHLSHILWLKAAPETSQIHWKGHRPCLWLGEMARNFWSSLWAELCPSKFIC